MALSKRAFAEFIGTFWLVFRRLRQQGSGRRLPWAGNRIRRRRAGFRTHCSHHGIRYRPHLGLPSEPAVSVGLVVGKRFPVSELPAYAIAQVLGAVAGSGILYLIASGKEGFSVAGGFASNGCGAHSPGSYALGAGTVVTLLGGGDRGSGVLGLRRSSRAGIQTQRGHRVNLDAQ